MASAAAVDNCSCSGVYADHIVVGMCPVERDKIAIQNPLTRMRLPRPLTPPKDSGDQDKNDGNGDTAAASVPVLVAPPSALFTSPSLHIPHSSIPPEYASQLYAATKVVDIDGIAFPPVLQLLADVTPNLHTVRILNIPSSGFRDDWPISVPNLIIFAWRMNYEFGPWGGPNDGEEEPLEEEVEKEDVDLHDELAAVAPSPDVKWFNWSRRPHEPEQETASFAPPYARPATPGVIKRVRSLTDTLRRNSLERERERRLSEASSVGAGAAPVGSGSLSRPHTPLCTSRFVLNIIPSHPTKPKVLKALEQTISSLATPLRDIVIVFTLADLDEEPYMPASDDDEPPLKLFLLTLLMICGSGAQITLVDFDDMAPGWLDLPDGTPATVCREVFRRLVCGCLDVEARVGENGVTDAPVTFLTREDYRDAVGAEQFALETEWEGLVLEAEAEAEAEDGEGEVRQELVGEWREDVEGMAVAKAMGNVSVGVEEVAAVGELA